MSDDFEIFESVAWSATGDDTSEEQVREAMGSAYEHFAERLAELPEHSSCDRKRALAAECFAAAMRETRSDHWGERITVPVEMTQRAVAAPSAEALLTDLEELRDDRSAVRPGPDGEADTRAARRAWERARSLAKTKLRRFYLDAFWARLQGESYESLASRTGRDEGALRTGVCRARMAVDHARLDLRMTEVGLTQADFPPALEPALALLREQNFQAADRALDPFTATHAENPHYLNLRGMIARADRRFEQAEAHYRKALGTADDGPVRAKILNNLANLLELTQGKNEGSRALWLRALRCRPVYPEALLNLLADASERRDLADCRAYMQTLRAMRSDGRLSEEQVEFIDRRLTDNDELAWIRSRTAWDECGPGRWVTASARRQDPHPSMLQSPEPKRSTMKTNKRRSSGAAVALALMMIFALGPLAMAGGGAPSPDSTTIVDIVWKDDTP